jgi:hypothetical protein
MRGGRVVTNARRDAVDADGVARRAAFFADGEVVWSWRPDAGAKRVERVFTRDGDNKARSHRGDHGISRKAIAQGMPECFGEPVVTNSCAFFTAREAAGALNTRHSLRPHHLRVIFGKARAHIAPRERGVTPSGLFEIQI